MINVIPAKKIGMTSVFDGSGTTVPVTLVQPEPVQVVEIKRPETHGYAAIKVAHRTTLPSRLNKPHQGELAKAGIEAPLKDFFEVRVSPEELTEYQLGQAIDPSDFLLKWGIVKVTGTTKGKGFAGAMKRWGFKGQNRTHGDPDNRRPMANNATDPARVFKGSKRPGRMGGTTNSKKGVAVFEFNVEQNLMVLNGSVPGPNGAYVFVALQQERSAEELAEMTEAPEVEE